MLGHGIHITPSFCALLFKLTIEKVEEVDKANYSKF